MDVIPPEYDEITKERVYRQEWLEYFNYIGYDAAMRDFPAQYHALFPNGHERPPTQSSAPAKPAQATPAAAQLAKLEDGGEKLASSHSPAASSVPSNAHESARRPAETDSKDIRDTRTERERRPYTSRRDDRYSAHERTRDDDDERRRHRRQGEESEQRHRSHYRSSRDDDYPATSSGSSRRRYRSDEREDRRGRYSHDDDSRRHRRDGDTGSSRGRAYDDRREDALRRRESNYRR